MTKIDNATRFRSQNFDPDVKLARVTIRLPAELVPKLRFFAKRNRKSVNRLLSLLIVDYLDREESNAKR